MKGDAQPLIKFFDGSDKRFIIPLYQRNYDWKEDNCEQLFQDLMKLHDSNRKSHFFDMPQGLVLDTQLIVAPKNANPKKSMR